MCIRYACETADISREERQRIEAEISQLQPTTMMTPGGARVQIKHQLHLTMVDGKVVAALAETGSATCNICGATPSLMNDLSAVTGRPVRSEIYQFGLSTMHAWIRFFECVVHIAYKIPIRLWRADSPHHKELIKQRKEVVKKRFREQMGLVVDQPKSGGAGTSNDGNTARRAFRDVDKLSEVTEVDVELLNRFAVILSALASSLAIDTDKFHQYATETARLFVDLYPWYYMPATVHKVLIHGADVIASLELPIGAYSEEAQEARNKHNRQYRLRHARKISRLQTITDQFHYLLVTSDPVISEIIERVINRPRRQRQLRTTSSVDISPLLKDFEREESGEDEDDGDDDAEKGYELL